MTIHLPSTLSPDMLERIVGYLRRQKVAFRLEQDTVVLPLDELEASNWDADLHPIIQNRLTEKYVKTGEWDKMDDDARQDACLLETMLWQREQPDEGHLPQSDTHQFLEDVKNGLYATHH